MGAAASKAKFALMVSAPVIIVGTLIISYSAIQTLEYTH